MQDGMLVYWESPSTCSNSDSKSHKVEKTPPNHTSKNDQCWDYKGEEKFVIPCVDFLFTENTKIYG